VERYAPILGIQVAMEDDKDGVASSHSFTPSPPQLPAATEDSVALTCDGPSLKRALSGLA
jgi:hypothetical protein